MLQQFRTTTPRTVGIELNMDKHTLNFWLNGRFLKERSKKLPEGQPWTPTIKFKEAEYFVIMNPFGQAKGYLAEEVNPNHLPNVRLRLNQLLNIVLEIELLVHLSFIY